MIQEQELANFNSIPSIAVVNEQLEYIPNPVVPQEIVVQQSNELDDSRLHIFRKLSKSLKPAVLLKSWQRVCMLVAGIETSQLYGQTNIATLEKEIYDRYHGNLNRDPPIIGTVKRAMEDQLEALNIERFGIRFPKDKISYVQMTAGMPGHTIWRYYKELVTEVTNRINMAYRQVLNDDLTYPEGKQLFDVIEDTLRQLWFQNEDTRKERITKRVDDGGRSIDDSDSEHETSHGHGHNHGGHGHESNPLSSSMDDDRFGTNLRKRHANLALLNTKAFPGVGKYQPIGFLAFLLMGPPAGEKCWTRFALDAHYEAAPPRPRLSVTNSTRHHRLSLNSGTDEDKMDDYISPRHDRKRPRTSKDGVSGGLPGVSGGPGGMFDDDNEPIRVFSAETAARAQRLEELKMALSLFPDDENIKAEFKQFLDTSRRTALTAEAMAAAAAAAAIVDPGVMHAQQLSQQQQQQQQQVMQQQGMSVPVNGMGMVNMASVNMQHAQQVLHHGNHHGGHVQQMQVPVHHDLVQHLDDVHHDLL